MSSIQFPHEEHVNPEAGPGATTRWLHPSPPLPRLMRLLLRLLGASQTVGAGREPENQPRPGVSIPGRPSTLPGVNVSPSLSPGSSKGCSRGGPEKPSLT